MGSRNSKNKEQKFLSVREFFDDPLFENLEPEIKQQAKSVTAPGCVLSRDFADSAVPATVVAFDG